MTTRAAIPAKRLTGAWKSFVERVLYPALEAYAASHVRYAQAMELQASHIEDFFRRRDSAGFAHGAPAFHH
jgi:hypothetical protein